jgi:hypothetical protein
MSVHFIFLSVLGNVTHFGHFDFRLANRQSQPALKYLTAPGARKAPTISLLLNHLSL